MAIPVRGGKRGGILPSWCRLGRKSPGREMARARFRAICGGVPQSRRPGCPHMKHGSRSTSELVEEDPNEIYFCLSSSN